MNLFNITLASQNKDSLDGFYSLIRKSKNYNSKFIKKRFTVKKNYKRITLLKSPHVNKTAQEHFEKRTFTKQFQIHLSKNKKCLTLLKKLNYYVFPDLKITLTLLINQKNQNLKISKVFTLNNFKLNRYKKVRNENIKPDEHSFKNQTFLKLNRKINFSLRIMDVFGESSKIKAWVAQ